MEFFIFGSAVLFWILVGAFFIALLWAEPAENGFIATLALIAFCALLWFFGTDTMKALWEYVTFKNILLYLSVGFLFMMFRALFYGRETGYKIEAARKEYKESKRIDRKLTENEEADFRKNTYGVESLIKNRDLSNHVARWWLNWPGSLLFWLLKDALKAFWNLIYQFIENLVNWVYEFGMNSVQKR